MSFRLFLAAALLIPGCAAVIATPTSRAKPASGIVVPLVKPLLVVENGTATIKTMPDPDRGYALNAITLFAKNTTNVQLNPDGTLKSIVTEQDNQQALQDLAKLAETMGIRVRDAGDGAAQSLSDIPRRPGVEVYEFIPTADGGTTLRRLYPS